MKYACILSLCTILLFSCTKKSNEDLVYDSFIGKDWNFIIDCLGQPQRTDWGDYSLMVYERSPYNDCITVYSTIYGGEITYLRKYYKVEFYFNPTRSQTESSICMSWIGYK